MPTNAKETDKSKAPAEETALNGDAAQPAAKKARSPRTRAYFIAEQRERMSLPGDADSDWLEARRQLLAELGES